MSELEGFVCPLCAAPVDDLKRCPRPTCGWRGENPVAEVKAFTVTQKTVYEVDEFYPLIEVSPEVLAEKEFVDVFVKFTFSNGSAGYRVIGYNHSGRSLRLEKVTAP